MYAFRPHSLTDGIRRSMYHCIRLVALLNAHKAEIEIAARPPMIYQVPPLDDAEKKNEKPQKQQQQGGKY